MILAAVTGALLGLLDAGAAAGPPGDAAAAPMAIEDFAPAGSVEGADAGAPTRPEPAIAAFDSAPSRVDARPFGAASLELGINTRPDAQVDPSDALARNLFELWGRANLGVDLKLSDSARLVVEGRLFFRGTTLPGFQRAKAVAEPYLGEAYLDLYGKRVDLRLGSQVVSFGANPLFAPADQLNPRDLRASFLQGSPEDVKLPALAVRAAGEVGKLSLTGAYFPFFTPDRYDVFGTNEALLQPTFGTRVPLRFSSSIEDPLQPRLLETRRPNAWPWLGDLGVQATLPAGRWKVGASWLWMNEKIPEVQLDPELASVLAAEAAGKTPDAAAVISLQNRFTAGQPLASRIYQRKHVLSLQASRLLGSTQLDLDLAYTPEQTFVDGNLNPVRKSSVTWVVGLSQAGDSKLFYNLTYLGLAVPGWAVLLVILEPDTAQGAARTAWLHLLVGNVSYKLFKDDLELSLRAAVEPIQGSFALGPRATYQLAPRWKLWAAAEFYQGSAFSPFGYLNRAGQVLVGARAELF